MSAWRTRSRGIIVGVGAMLAVAACGGGARQDAGGPHGEFPVTVDSADFPAAQRLSEHTHLVIAVRNAGSRTMPNVAVTLCNVTCAYPAPPGEGTSVRAFAQNDPQAFLADPSRPTWIVDRGPGRCAYGCRGGGPGAGVTAYAGTWALGSLAPGRTARFQWAVTAVAAGRHVIAWQVAAGLDGKAEAIAANGSPPSGTFTVHVDAAPQRSYVDDAGRIVSRQR